MHDSNCSTVDTISLAQNSVCMCLHVCICLCVWVGGVEYVRANIEITF